jgi:hypothetical protein
MANGLIRDGTAGSSEALVARKSPRSCSAGATTSISMKDRTFVDHTYHDHLHDPEAYDSSDRVADKESTRKKGPRGGVTITFPEKLHLMLRSCEDEGLSEVACWQPHGRYVTCELQMSSV